MKTTDGGHTWQIQKVITDSPNNPVGSIFVVDEAIVYALISSGIPGRSQILKTSDGGISWQNISPNNASRNFHSVWFVNADTGFVAGSFSDVSGNSFALILKTENGGNTWTEKIITELPSIHDLQFIDDSTGFFLAGYNPVQLYKTEDAFETVPASPLIDTTCVFSYQALNRDTIYADVQEGGLMYWGSSGYTLKKSTNSGLYWVNKFFTNWFVCQIYFCHPQVGFLIGGQPYGGTIFRSVDSGDHWESQLLSYPFHDVDFIDKDTGFACGGLNMTHFSNGNIFVTHDGGENWEVILNTEGVQTCLFINDRLGFACVGDCFGGGGAYLLRTTDGGKSWSDSIHFNCNDLLFINDNSGWAVGAGILMTIDQGENWKLVWELPDQLHSIHFIDSTTGWAVGDNGLMVKCTNGNQWEELTKITDLPLNKVFFINENSGFIAGGYLDNEGNFLAILFKTTNSGATWEKIPDFPYLIHDIYFHNEHHGWAVGTDKFWQGVILETDDNGDHWSVQVDSLIGSLNALSYRDGFLWAVGDYGLVLRLAVDSTTQVDAHQDDAAPLSYKLMQNYPNPFNAVTAVSYQLSAVSQVELGIYNLFGQRVATLVSARRPAGSYIVEWDGAEFSSGVYFCRMKSADFVKVIKLALVK
jgi:photosystem II stability/assembly factor-like uncharacterized protein